VTASYCVAFTVDYSSLLASRLTDTIVSVTHQWSRRQRHCPPLPLCSEWL